MKKKCEVCQSEFEVRPSHFHLRKTCSFRCRSVLRKNIMKVMPESKTCTLCRQIKLVEEFKGSRCRSCRNMRRLEYNHKNIEDYRKKHREYQAKRRVAGLVKRDYERKAESDRAYRAKNRDHLRELARARKNKRRKEDLKFVLNERVRHSIWKAIRAKKSGRKWEALVGYSLGDLVRRLKKTMPAGYTFSDYLSGKLQIDHIIPRAAFNFSDPQDFDFKRCWALKNLRLLSKEENYKKRAKIDGQFQPSLQFAS